MLLKFDAELPAGKGQTDDFATKVGTEMGADLIASPGLTISPAGIVREQLLPSGPTRWDWQFSATTKGQGELELRTYVFLKLSDGTLASHPLAQSKLQYIVVDVSSDARLHALAGGMSTGISDLTKIVTGIAGLLAAGFAAWTALRKFGGRGKDSGGAAPPS